MPDNKIDFYKSKEKFGKLLTDKVIYGSCEPYVFLPVFLAMNFLISTIFSAIFFGGLIAIRSGMLIRLK